MTCYAIPTLAAIAHYFLKKRVNSWKNDKYHQWLSHLLIGGAVFGMVDHLWNGELFLIGEKIMLDFLLGVVITIVILVIWKTMVFADRTSAYTKSKNKIRT
ncbi:hypothetical protein HQ533_04505 [Candidatus Woesearchaeota archaeon]|nr:hypothetical protein [Candidatus Woesearchaeota archaeon]